MSTAPPPRARPRNLQQELGKKNPFDRPEEEAYLNLVRTAELLRDRMAGLFAEHGLSEPQYNALRIVAARGDTGIPSQAIADDMVARDPDMTRLVDRLEQAGFVIRRRCAEDRRRVYVRITPKGRRVIQAIRKPAADLLRQLLGHLGPAGLRRLSKLLFDARHPPADA